MRQKRAFKKIDWRIYTVFLIVIAIGIINAVISTYTIRKSQQITSDIVNNTNPSLDALAKMNLLVTRSRMLVTNWVYLPNNKSDKDSLIALNNIDYIELRGRFNGLMPYWNQEANMVAMKGILVEYEELISCQTKITRILNSFDDYQDPTKKFAAEDILEREIIPRSEKITVALKSIINTQTTLALKEQDKMLYSFNSLMVLVLGIALLIIISILVAAFIITRFIIVPIMQVREVIMQMGRGELPVLRMKIPKNAVGEMFQALGFLIDGFRQTSKFVEEIGKGNFNVQYQPLSEKDIQGHALLNMRSQLQEAANEEARRSWMSEALADLNETMRTNNDDFNVLLDKIIESIVGNLKVEQSAIFLLHNEDMNDLHIQLGAYYALNNRILNSKRYELKEGLVGQAISANKAIFLDSVQDAYFTIDTGMGESKQCSLYIIPLNTSGKVVGAIQIASLKPLTLAQRELLAKMAEPIAASLFSVRANLITTQLLDESRKQADELVYQEQELRKINNELTKQSQLLQQSEEELKEQQEELKQVNKELQHKAAQLEEQNHDIEVARQSLSFKAEQLEQSNKYKSAFLANMSHELRTPLNSILILARLLADNKTKNLEGKQVEHANIIHKSGSDLLMLINDILDLSKIEAGKVDLQYEDVKAKVIIDDTRLLFRELATDKKINFEIKNDLKEDFTFFADKTRVEQVLKNLLSNAFKFTGQGGKVTLKIGFASSDIVFKTKSLLQSEKVICFSVEDTGIGIAEDKQKLVFEAFQQADGSTSRKFGGTGLGLAISRELMLMMGGEMMLESIEGSGSTFMMYLPAKINISPAVLTIPEVLEVNDRMPEVRIPSPSFNKQQSGYSADEIRDDRTLIQSNDKVVLIIEDDYVFARMLMNHCHKTGFKAIIALQGDQGLAYATHYTPYAIILDLRLPVMDGWTVLKKLKENALLKKIPVHIVSSLDKKQLGLDMGAATYLNKPAGKEEMEILFESIIHEPISPTRKLLYFGDRKNEMNRILNILHEREKNLIMETAVSITDCSAKVQVGRYECLVVDSGVNEAGTKELVQQIRSNEHLRNMPLIFCADNADECLREVEEVMNTEQDDLRNDELDQAGNFLNTISEGKEKFDEVQSRMNDLLSGKTVLLVDDDMRNIYSLTHILENEGINVIPAYDGIEAIEKLKQNDHTELILMDLMMPNMNGYDAIAEIRKDPHWMNLPIIAVTAKAMTGDREKCMEAGASDYLTKPVQADQLISLMKVWLYK